MSGSSCRCERDDGVHLDELLGGVRERRQREVDLAAGSAVSDLSAEAHAVLSRSGRMSNRYWRQELHDS